MDGHPTRRFTVPAGQRSNARRTIAEPVERRDNVEPVEHRSIRKLMRQEETSNLKRAFG